MINGKDGEGDTNYNTVSGCYVHDNTHEGIYLKSGWGQEQVIGNVVEYNTITGSGDEAVQNNRYTESPLNPPYPSGTVVRGNVIYNNVGNWGMMQLYGDRLLVEDNIVYNNAGTQYVSGIAYGFGEGTIIRNNLLVNNDGAASYDAAIFAETATNLTIAHNTIYEHGGYGIYMKQVSSDAIVANNLISRVEGTAIQLSEGTSGVTPTHNLVSDNPLFVDPAGMDFHLLSTSPAVDAGVDVAVLDDLERHLRPQGEAVDIGAYEYMP
jgi:parallel beta-helix repeat protein